MKSLVPYLVSQKLKFLFTCLLCFFCFSGQVKAQYNPAEDLGELFEAVQLAPVFPDSKTFPDCIPLLPPKQILEAYRQERNNDNFNLEAFVLKYFRLPQQPVSNFSTDTTLSLAQHINQLWPVLTRLPGSDSSSLIPLPYPYIVPGGRFREIYYWDSFFTMLGLQTSGESELVQHMVDNFSYLIDTIGHIPNGNRIYYVSRSQPPFYALMLDILANEKGQNIILKYAPTLRKEYDFWMDGATTLSRNNNAHRRVVLLPDGSILNRYWDDNPAPRPESYKEDVHLAKESGRAPEEVYRDIRAAAESGWDFSSRWFADGKTLSTIHTTDIIPVDLNSLLYHIELTLAKAASLEENRLEELFFLKKAKARKKALLKYTWNKKDKYFYDYDFKKNVTTKVATLASVFPLYFKIAKPGQAAGVKQKIETTLLKPGGLVTTNNHTGEQWDAPNGWAPLQWMSIQALRNYNYTTLADTVTLRWVKLNRQVFQKTGRLMEKYNVEDLSLKAGGGEYPLQDGFGWTNGILIKLLHLNPDLLKKQMPMPALQKQ